VQLLQVSTAFEQTLVSNLQLTHNLITILHLKLLAQKFLLVCGGENEKKNIAKLSKPQNFLNETLVETLLAFKNIL
jgi:hypothetical protein